MSSRLQELLESRRVIVCAGAGGVGKTTVTAALGLSAALQGRRVLCLTIDPARRLAQSLGVDQISTEAQHIDLKKLGVRGGAASLTVMMLDVKRTFDHLITEHARDQRASERLLNNRLYRYLSDSLAGTHDYMAMEKLLEVEQSGDYDLIVLDTPPAAHALDFLEAPERLVQTIDNPAMHALGRMFRVSGVFQLDLVKRGLARSLRALSLITSTAFLEQVVALVGSFNDLFAGFSERAERISRAFRSNRFAYVVIASPERFTLDKAQRFAQRLLTLGMDVPVLIVNRVEPAPGAHASASEIEQALARHGVAPDPSLVSGVERAVSQARTRAREVRAELHHFAAVGGPVNTALNRARFELPAFAEEVYDLPALLRMAELLTGVGID